MLIGAHDMEALVCEDPVRLLESLYPLVPRKPKSYIIKAPSADEAYLKLVLDDREFRLLHFLSRLRSGQEGECPRNVTHACMRRTRRNIK